MKTSTFTADSASDAIAQIKQRLGPEAVVLNVRQVPANGLSRLWQKPRIEVTAGVPETATPAQDDPILALRREMAELRQHLAQPPASPATPHPALPVEAAAPGLPGLLPDLPPAAPTSAWRVEGLLKESGLMPLPLQRVMEAIIDRHGERPPGSWQKEIAIARDTLGTLWRGPGRNTPAGDTHLFIGPPGAGKTTALAQWLTHTVLLEGRTARVWRLDGRSANTAESLGVHCEILGVPVERIWPAGPAATAGEVTFIDLPGIPANDRVALTELAAKLAVWPNLQIHLVLNGAYESATLLAQARAFSALPVSDLIVTHLDEELRWGKMWNLVLGTNFSLRFLGAGQNIPGDFQIASAEKILARQFPCK